MQFNLVNNQEQVAQFVQRGVVWGGVAYRTVVLHGISVRVISIAVGGGGACSISSVGVY